MSRQPATEELDHPLACPNCDGWGSCEHCNLERKRDAPPTRSRGDEAPARRSERRWVGAASTATAKGRPRGRRALRDGARRGHRAAHRSRGCPVQSLRLLPTRTVADTCPPTVEGGADAEGTIDVRAVSVLCPPSLTIRVMIMSLTRRSEGPNKLGSIVL